MVLVGDYHRTRYCQEAMPGDNNRFGQHFLLQFLFPKQSRLLHLLCRCILRHRFQQYRSSIPVIFLQYKW